MLKLCNFFIYLNFQLKFAGQYMDEEKYEEFPYEVPSTIRSTRSSNNEGVIDKYSHSSQGFIFCWF